MAAAAKTQHGRFQAMALNYGFEILYPSTEEPAASKSPINFEIVAIPGLGTDEEWSWKFEKVNWLRETNMLARKIPDARISIFVYSPQWFGKESVSQRLDNVAYKLLYGLDRIRRANNTETAIIFVCHSLGGIILEKALLTARSRQVEFPYVYPWVAGSVFLGTPFHGVTEPRAQVLAEMAQGIGMGDPSDLVKYLEKDNEKLGKLLDEFGILARDIQMRLYCFFEQKESDRVKVVVKGMPKVSFKRQERIVDEVSASITSAEKFGLDVDHFQLNKYDGSKDPNFTIVSEEIRIATQKADSILKSRQNAVRQALVDERIFYSMVDHLGKGFQDIESAINGSYRGQRAAELSSVLKQAAFSDWKQQDTIKLLWVHGKAGNGQGAIASSAIEYLKKSREGQSVVTSFYCDQSDKHRRSLKSLLQMIVRQVISTNRDLARHLLSDSKRTKEVGKQEFDPEATLKVQVLWDALQTMAKDIPGGIYVVIYGLEQLSEDSQDSLDDFLAYMRELPETTLATRENRGIAPIKWMLLSRTGRPNIGKSLKPRALEIDLEDKKNVEQVSVDLRNQISVSVDALELPSSLAYFVKRHVHARAEDNWIYVTLVIQELRNAWVPGRTQHADIRKLLESFPFGLTNMFEHVRKRVLSLHAEGLEYTKEILRCRICAYVAPTMRELALMAGLPKEDRADLNKLKAYIVRCGAFLTLRGSDLEYATVEWIEPAAQEHLQQYARDALTLDLQDMQHGIIALRSLEYIYEELDPHGDTLEEQQEDKPEEEGDNGDIDKTESVDAESSAATEDSTSSDEASEANVEDEASSEADVPNSDDGVGGSMADLKYPVRYWVEHAVRAPRDVLNEFNLDHSFWQEDSRARQKWWQLIADVHTYRNQDKVTALHVAVILNFAAMVDYLLEHGMAADVHKDDSFGFQPLYYACKGGNEEIVNALLGATPDIDYTSDGSQPSALQAASSNGYFNVVKTLLDRDANIDATSPDHGTALYAAIENNDQQITELLLSRGAKVNVIGGASRRAVNIGAFVGNLEGVQTLIDHGADIDPDEDYWYGSALGAASRNGHADVVEFLLARSWSPSRPMKTYGSCLTAAATYNHLDVVKILLKEEERVPILEQALCAAAQRGYASIVEVILTKRSTIRRLKAFSLAASYGRTEVLKLLFERDDSRELRDDFRARDEALYQATDNEHEETIKLLLEHNADPNAEGPTYGFALAASAYDGTTGIMKALLAKGADVNKRGGEYGTALQGPAYRGNSENVKLLIDHGALLNTEPIGTYGNELQAAVFTGDEDTIRILLEHGADVNTFGGLYSYAIIAAVSRGNSRATRILLDHNAHVNVRGGEDNWPVVSLAASTLQKEDLRLILKNVADINATCDKGTTALINCADAGDTDGVKFLLNNDADVSIISESLGSALHAAAAIGDEACCEVLLKAGADVNAIGGEWGTSIQAASWAEDIETVRVLLSAGADVMSETAISGFYGTALQAASAAGALEIVQELLNGGAAVNVQPSHGEYGCALSAAVAGGYYNVARLLVEYKADVNFQGGYHHFPIMAAAQSGNFSVVELLLEHGASASAKGGMWGSTLVAAAYGENQKIVEMLMSHGADVHFKGGHYGSALQAACVKAEVDTIDYLLDRALDLVNHRDGKYHTALIAAAYFDRIDVVSKLLEAGADFRYQGGRFRSAISAAAIRGNRAILEKLLKMRGPDHLLDEALVEAVAHRQSASVDLLLKSGANINFRHPTLGLATNALEAPAVDEENSDEEGEDLEDEEEEEEEDDAADEEEDSNNDETWEGDSGSVSGETEEGSVTDLQLEEEFSEDVKIQKLLEEAVVRCKRNPTVKRFRTVKHRDSPNSGSTGPPPPPVPQLPLVSTYEAYNLPIRNANFGSQYGQHLQEPWSLPFESGPVQERQTALDEHQQPPSSSHFGYTAYPAPLIPRKQVQSSTEYPQRIQSPPTQQQQQYPFPPTQPERQYSTGTVPGVPRSFTPPSRKGSEDSGLKRQSKAINRKSIVNLGLPGKHQQRQQSYPSPQGSMDRAVDRQDFAMPPQSTPPPPPAPYHQYTSPQQYPPTLPHRQSQHFSPPQQPPPLPHRQSQQFNPPQQPPYQASLPYRYPPYTSPPPQGPGYIPSSQPSQMSSPAASVQSSQYANSTPPGAQSFTWDTPASSVHGFKNPDDPQGRKWSSGGYDGEGYG